jgi:hypothetical protein
MRYIALACHEAENLYLSDEVLALLGTNWADAARAIKARASEFGQKADALLAIATVDRKTADLKGVMNELMLILDEKGVHWTLRVARAIGEKRPTGQLADFLGAQVVEAFWGKELQAAENEVMSSAEAESA